MLQLRSEILENVPLAERTYRIRLQAPAIAHSILPGQFLMLKLPGLSDPLLGRPFAVYDVDFASESIDVVYLVLGKMTALLAEAKAGQHLEVWGPLGNGFPELGDQNEVILVAGGIGQTPFLAYAHHLLGNKGYGRQSPRKRASKVRLYYGVRTQSLLAGVADFEAAGVTVHLASDDGSVGFHGYVTQLLDSHDPQCPLVGCGPEPMLHSLAKLAERRKLSCHVSLETPMACGFGACYSCVTKIKTADGFDYKRVCVEGPVFDANRLVW